MHGVVAEDAIDRAAVEAEAAQSPLHLGDVVAAQHRPASVQKARAEREAGFDDRRPRLQVAEAVLGEAAVGLEHGERAGCPMAELTRGVGDLIAERDEPRLQVGDLDAAIAATQRQRVRREFSGCVGHPGMLRPVRGSPTWEWATM